MNLIKLGLKLRSAEGYFAKVRAWQSKLRLTQSWLYKKAQNYGEKKEKLRNFVQKVIVSEIFRRLLRYQNSLQLNPKRQEFSPNAEKYAKYGRIQ